MIEVVLVVIGGALKRFPWWPAKQVDKDLVLQEMDEGD